MFVERTSEFSRSLLMLAMLVRPGGGETLATRLHILSTRKVRLTGVDMPVE